MTKLNYDITTIVLPSLAQANEKLEEVKAVITEVEEQKANIYQKIAETKAKQAAEATKVKKLSDIAAKAKAVFTKESDIEELKLQLEMLDQFKTDNTGDLLVEATTFASNLSDETTAYIEPYYDVMCRANADATDSVALELNRLLTDYVMRFNGVLEETGWFSPLSSIQPTHNGKPIKPLTIGMGEAVISKGTRLKQLMEGL